MIKWEHLFGVVPKRFIMSKMLKGFLKMSKLDLSLMKCLTPVGRASFPNVFKPKAFKEGQEAKYSLSIIFEKNTDLSKLKQAAQNAAIEKYGDLSKLPKNFKWPFRRGDDGDYGEKEGYGADKIFITSTSKKQPGIVDNNVQRIINEADFYAGCWCRAELIAFCYDQSGNRGVSFALQNIQKVRDDKPFSGRRAAEDVFGVIDDGSNDASAYATPSGFDMGI